MLRHRRGMDEAPKADVSAPFFCLLTSITGAP